MTDNDEETRKAKEAKHALMGVIGEATAGAAVQLLHQLHGCACIGCQLYVAEMQVRSACNGQDIRPVLLSIDTLIHELLIVRRVAKRQKAFNELATRIGVPLTETPTGRAN